MPQPDEDIGAGVGSQAVSQHIADLQSDVTYHFRVVATNQWGTRESPDTTFDFAPPSCPNGHVRQQTGSSYLPDCRAYELVSPENAGSILMQPSDAIWGVSLSSGCAGTGCLVRYGNLWTVNTGLSTSPARFTFYAGWGGIDPVRNELRVRSLHGYPDEHWMGHHSPRLDRQRSFAGCPPSLFGFHGYVHRSQRW